jgi:uncharacterized protein
MAASTGDIMIFRFAVAFAVAAFATLPASAEKPRQDCIHLLLVDGQNNHDWPRATRILTQILESSGRFRVEVSTTPAANATKEAWDRWRPDFTKYNVVLSNFNGGHMANGVHWPREVEKALEDYVSGGGGLVIYHAANNSFVNWPAYNEMIGLGWRDKGFGPSLIIDPDEKVIEIPRGQGLDPGHGPEHDFQITVRNTGHPITQGMPTKWLHPHEQLTHGQHGPAKNLTVLTYAWSKDSRENEPMDWVIPYGKGRVYSTMLGHLWKDGPDTAMRCVGFQIMLIRGCEWAATGNVTYPIPKNFPTATEIRLAKPQKAAYVPEPDPVATQILVGAQNCPLWEADKPQMWNQVLKHPERTPALGFYSQDNPEVADWETKWAVEHGVSFFVYCWYRNGQGGPVKMNFGSAIHDALLKSRYVSKMKFSIMWENQARGTAGVSGEADLMENLLPFWIDSYFRHSSYLKIDNKPLLFIYRPEFLVQDLGGVDKVRAALDKMRAACRKAGFAGLYVLGEYRGLDAKHLELMKQLGLDYTFAYCWHVQGNPSPQQAIAAQLDYINKTRRIGILPEIVTVSQGWSGWNDEGSIWKLPPRQYRELLENAKAIVRSFPASELGSKMLLLDNWNEWSEGHYIAPHREYGFGYLDAVREVFSDSPKKHVDLLPGDVGMGPYDRAYKRPVSKTK